MVEFSPLSFRMHFKLFLSGCWQTSSLLLPCSITCSVSSLVTHENYSQHEVVWLRCVKYSAVPWEFRWKACLEMAFGVTGKYEFECKSSTNSQQLTSLAGDKLLVIVFSVLHQFSHQSKGEWNNVAWMLRSCPFVAEHCLFGTLQRQQLPEGKKRV